MWEETRAKTAAVCEGRSRVAGVYPVDMEERGVFAISRSGKYGNIEVCSTEAFESWACGYASDIN